MLRSKTVAIKQSFHNLAHMLIKSDLEASRSPQDLANRCSTLFAQLGANDETKRSLRHRTGLFKNLVEEIWPAAIWSMILYSDTKGVSVEPKLDSGRRDAIVTTPWGQYPIEITQAHTGESEHLRTIHLEEHGWAPGPLSEMTKSGTKKTGLTVKPGRTLGTMIGHVSQVRKLLEDAIRKKAKKSYPNDTRLIVMFEDFVLKDEAGIEAELISSITTVDGEIGLPFSHVYLVGWSRKLFFEYEK